MDNNKVNKSLLIPIDEKLNVVYHVQKKQKQEKSDKVKTSGIKLHHSDSLVFDYIS